MIQTILPHNPPFDSTLLPAVGACSKVMLLFDSPVNYTHMPAVCASQGCHALQVSFQQ